MHDEPGSRRRGPDDPVSTTSDELEEPGPMVPIRHEPLGRPEMIEAESREAADQWDERKWGRGGVR